MKITRNNKDEAVPVLSATDRNALYRASEVLLQMATIVHRDQSRSGQYVALSDALEGVARQSRDDDSWVPKEDTK